ncbi:unnamed protein product [Echinostoma caproni]|uniref:Uncharacterized protein n=1 Tax=Echinostoma caproni TaxID=27848 RepID=A0A3P8HTM3_9TREM|nr:unnamed protein product [Echinostoma caproni]
MPPTNPLSGILGGAAGAGVGDFPGFPGSFPPIPGAAEPENMALNAGPLTAPHGSQPSRSASTGSGGGSGSRSISAGQTGLSHGTQGSFNPNVTGSAGTSQPEEKRRKFNDQRPHYGLAWLPGVVAAHPRKVLPYDRDSQIASTE